ncbi:hypothetical protein E4U61_000115 [Claviceps capensis]|nr:hypothetical protein E4U61_000115 [Claviceps capensis]
MELVSREKVQASLEQGKAASQAESKFHLARCSRHEDDSLRTRCLTSCAQYDRSHTVGRVFQLTVISAFGGQGTGGELPVASPHFSIILALHNSAGDLMTASTVTGFRAATTMSSTYVEDEEHTVSMANAKPIPQVAETALD